ncbi:uncharacterized protein BO87DRAFT_297743 [Aspergillus neoniger CBS 115656]|uniref:Uncharacterized protein n=1 Tax=Aspergillus neoniger (strain CBS 115656) TaxID=1448310 RepID=A0A318ZTT8_ASPNB|nr:hypothetical protein BO87DRAFT_297743 [Aspergillus neoniger CBS 115656]PYH39132.1 hypothetical protein BO87DRAFT_297743 [Aspergillus neoniger CBS 115656]
MIDGTLLPSWFRILLLGLSIYSYIPQLQLLWTTKNSSSLSLCYLLFNLICATEQFLLAFICISNPDPNVFVEDRGSLRDWLNLIQITVVWLLSGLTSYPSTSSFRQKLYAALWYIIFLLIAVLPALCVAATPDLNKEDPSWAHELLFVMMSSVHVIFVSPVTTILAFGALFCQTPKLRKGVPSPRALSLRGLALQTGVFSVLALTWPFRIIYLGPEWDILSSWFALFNWYMLVGWVAVDSAVIALVQGILLWLAYRNRKYWRFDEGDETEPLLANRE